MRNSWNWLLVAVALVCSACGDVESQRASFLQNTLIEDNYMLMHREPELTAGKFRKMRATPYNYLRGTAPQYYRDLVQNEAVDAATDFGLFDSSRVLLVGDPHPENLGSFRTADGITLVDFNDFDAARYGPYHFDVRRLALGFMVAGETIGRELVSDAERAAWSAAVVDGYMAEIDALGAAKADLEVTRDGGFGPIVDDLIRRADRDGAISEELLDYTEVGDTGVRRARYGIVEPSSIDGVIGDEFEEPGESAQRLVTNAILRYAATRLVETSASHTTIKGMGRRLGAGVASYPVLRWYVITEGPTVGVEDDVLLEVKEILEPARMPGLATLRTREWESNGERVVDAQRRLSVEPTTDPLLGWAVSGAVSFRVRHRTKYQKGIDVARLGEKLSEGDWTTADIEEFARLAGRLLAQAHARGGNASDSDADNAEAIAAAIGPGFRDETLSFVELYFEQLMNDYALFAQLLADEGDLLGFRARQ